MTVTHTLGFPRIGRYRELKRALERYWRNSISSQSLRNTGKMLRAQHWALQASAGIEMVSVGDFAWYDHVLSHALMVGAIPSRFAVGETTLETLFAMARGVGAQVMTKWFDTNYHYIVPEFNQQFELSWTQLFEEVDEAQTLNYKIKPIVLGPITFIWLSNEKLSMLDCLLPVYAEIVAHLSARSVEWVQIDEPILAIYLPKLWSDAYHYAFCALSLHHGIMLTTSFGALEENFPLAVSFPVEGVHIVRSHLDQWLYVDALGKVFSLGVVNGRNVWRCDRDSALLQLAHNILGDRLWVAPSCSLLHVPVDLDTTSQRQWLSFATQKCNEVALLARVVIGVKMGGLQKEKVRKRLAAICESSSESYSYSRRQLLPTTTIGSFPQTKSVRGVRADYRHGYLDKAAYVEAMHNSIANTIYVQELVGLDVLVHGEQERNDMVEYFAEHLDGYLITRFGWVQSYGSRCVKPAIISGDVTRTAQITVDWIAYSQSLTVKPIKGILTGPVTMLTWSYTREDVSREIQACQLALALRDEVHDLAAGIDIIQIDEAALRECMPLHHAKWQHYLNFAVYAFRITRDQIHHIHTHMCYSEFNEIMAAIAAMDADVITIETSRSQRKTKAKEIGPGVYDIHSPQVPASEDMIDQLRVTVKRKRIWVNPDCGIKTRGWSETEQALVNMVAAAARLRTLAWQ